MGGDACHYPAPAHQYNGAATLRTTSNITIQNSCVRQTNNNTFRYKRIECMDWITSNLAILKDKSMFVWNVTNNERRKKQRRKLNE